MSKQAKIYTIGGSKDIYGQKSYKYTLGSYISNAACHNRKVLNATIAKAEWSDALSSSSRSFSVRGSSFLSHSFEEPLHSCAVLRKIAHGKIGNKSMGKA